MTISMYDITVPPLVLALGNLKHLLKTGAGFGAEQDFDEGVVLSTRLYPNMLPFVKQVQIATDMSKGCLARLSGTEAPKYDDSETTFDELIKRCDDIIAFIEGIPEDKISGTEEKEIVMQVPGTELKFVGFGYVSKFVIPNVQFHVTTVYNILRSQGVPLGKRDFLGAFV